MVREGLLQGARRRPDGVRQGDHARLPEAGEGEPSRTPTPARRSASRRSAPPTTCVGDAEKRKEYDEVRAPRAGRRLRRRPAGRWHLPHGGHGRPGRPLRGPLRGGGGRTRTTQRGPQRGADMEAQLHLSFQDAVHGVTTSVNVPQEVRCSNCRGTGAAPGTSTHTCPRCGGTGSLNDNQGLFSLSTVCPDCMGRGHAVRHAVPGLPRDGQRAEGALGQGPDPGRGRGRPAHQGQGTGRARTGHGAGRRPLRRRPRGRRTRSSGAAGAT